jgi:hypothetical protein
VDGVITLVRDGDKVIDDSTTNSTTSVSQEDTVSVFGTGTSYYFDPELSYTIAKGKTTPVINMDAYSVVATTDMVITAYADDGVTALTADDHDNNTADYAGGNIGAGENYQYVFKIKNNVADKTWRLGTILVGHCGGEADDHELLGTYDGSNADLRGISWTEVSLPPGKLGDTVAIYDDTNASTSCSWKRAYVPSGDFVDIYEWEWIKVQTNFDSDDTTQPSANGDSYIVLGHADYSCETWEDGTVACDFYKHDKNNDPADIGVDESLDSTMGGLDIAVIIEPQ